jgi:hypothetical protein
MLLSNWIFYVLLTVHIGIIFVNDQLDAQFLFYMFISILYMFRATSWSSSGECKYVGMQVGKELPSRPAY